MLEKGKNYICIEDALFKSKERSPYGLSFKTGKVYACDDNGIIVGEDQFCDRFNSDYSSLNLCLIDEKYKEFVDKVLLYNGNGIDRLGVEKFIDKEVIENSLRFLGSLVREDIIDKVYLAIQDARDGWTIFFDFYRLDEQYRSISVEIGKTQIAWDTFWDDNVIGDESTFEKGMDTDFYSIPERLKKEFQKLFLENIEK